MTLELTAADTEELRRVLESYLSDLRMEIAGTDSWDFRQALKERKMVLVRLLERTKEAAGTHLP
jgi:hypothetical protein